MTFATQYCAWTTVLLVVLLFSMGIHEHLVSGLQCFSKFLPKVFRRKVTSSKLQDAPPTAFQHKLRFEVTGNDARTVKTFDYEMMPQASIDLDAMLKSDSDFIRSALLPELSTPATRRRWEDVSGANREEPIRESIKEEEERMPEKPSSRGMTNGRADRANKEISKLAKELADLIANKADADPREKVLAQSILGIIDPYPVDAKSSAGRIYEDALTTGVVYLGHGEHCGEYEFTFLGKVPGDSSKISILRKGGKATVELMADHGLSAYDKDGACKYWHPTNWTESTGIMADAGKRMLEEESDDDTEIPEAQDEF